MNRPDSSRKYRTAKKIQSAAVRLAAGNGLNTVTAEAIAREAGISTRSFFNYYPYKEAALLGPSPDYPTEAVDHFILARGQLVLDLKDLTRVHLARFLNERRQIRDILHLAETDPKLKALRQNNLLARRSEMARILSLRLPTTPAVTVEILAAAIIAATGAALTEWAEGRHDDLIELACANLDRIGEAATLLRSAP